MALEEGLKPNGKPYRVVICDDKAIDAQQIRQILESRSYRVEAVFDNGRKLLNWYAEHGDKIDLIILDIIMPVLDGYATFWKLKEMNPMPRIVFVSVENTATLIKSVLSMGAVDFITKPVKRDIILERISKAVRRPMT
jgi:two-component system, chemotaxis family, chemotaxis protein CheY